MKRGIIIVIILILAAIMAHFFGVTAVIVGLVCLGLGLLIGRQRGHRQRDIVVRIKR